MKKAEKQNSKKVFKKPAESIKTKAIDWHRINFWRGAAVVFVALVFLSIFFNLFFKNLFSVLNYNQENQVELNLKSDIDFIKGGSSLSSGQLNFAAKNSPTEEAAVANKTAISEEPLSSTATLNETEFMTLPNGESSLANLSFLNSPDGSRFAYVVKKEGQFAVLLNGEQGPYYDEITFMSFSPDSHHFAYGARMGNKEMVVLDSQPGTAYDWVFLPRFFTPDSRYFVYKTRTETGDILVFNNMESRVYEQIYNPFVSADGSELIYYSRIGAKIYKTSLALQR
jgi:hypothetical protein